jgi:hypothetical protein
MTLANDRVEALVLDLQAFNEPLHSLVQGVRAVVRAVAPAANEAVMYGGIMFAAPTPFCGVFAYKTHVSVEFGRGCDLEDHHHVLEGRGKFRRHIKLRSVEEIETKHVADYVAQAGARGR